MGDGAFHLLASRGRKEGRQKGAGVGGRGRTRGGKDVRHGVCVREKRKVCVREKSVSREKRGVSAQKDESSPSHGRISGVAFVCECSFLLFLSFYNAKTAATTDLLNY